MQTIEELQRGRHPPYGVDYHPEWRNEAGIDREGRTQRIKSGKTIRTIGARAVGRVTNDDRADWREAWELFRGDVAYVWYGSIHGSVVEDSLQAAGFDIRSQIVWAKNRFVIGRGHYHWQHETCWYAVRRGRTAHWVGDHKQSTLWQLTHMVSETGHGTQKPVEAMRRPIENNSKPGQAVYDPFLGSGTTMIAAEMTGRACYGVEISPEYVDLGVRRWEQFTKKTAELIKNIEAPPHQIKGVKVAKKAKKVGTGGEVQCN